MTTGRMSEERLEIIEKQAHREQNALLIELCRIAKICQCAPKSFTTLGIRRA